MLSDSLGPNQLQRHSAKCTIVHGAATKQTTSSETSSFRFSRTFGRFVYVVINLDYQLHCAGTEELVSLYNRIHLILYLRKRRSASEAMRWRKSALVLFIHVFVIATAFVFDYPSVVRVRLVGAKQNVDVGLIQTSLHALRPDEVLFGNVTTTLKFDVSVSQESLLLNVKRLIENRLAVCRKVLSSFITLEIGWGKRD